MIPSYRSMRSQPGDKAITSAWSPLRQPLFRSLWIASVASNIGTWMQAVGSAWLMTALDPSPIMVALVQTAASLPFFLLALPAGALADIVDRRKLLLLTQAWMLVAAAALGVLTIIGATTPFVLLAFTFLIALGTAMNAPAWEAIVPELVPRSDIQGAVALSGIGVNVGRAIGPALGGFLVAFAGAGAVFLLNAASFMGVLAVLYRWDRPKHESVLPAERMIGAIRAGMRYMRHAPAMHTVLVRIGVFIFCGSAMWALLPLLARQEMMLDAVGYGALLGFFGLGAIAAAVVLPRVKQRFSAEHLVVGATVLFATFMLALSYMHDFGFVSLAMLAGGAAWITLMSSFNAAAQTASPSWVHARGLAMYLLMFQGGMAAGTLLWGAVAEYAGMPAALQLAAIGLLSGIALSVRYRLTAGEDMTPWVHWPGPIVMTEPSIESGPVLVMVEYRIDPKNSHDFALAMRALRSIRLRDGAIQWGLFSDAADPDRFVETFMVESWAEHLRQHERMTIADRNVEEHVRGFHTGGALPKVNHFNYASDMEKKERT